MLFNSIEYLLFLVVLIALYWSAPHGWRRVILLLGSIVFYLSWSYLFLLHFAAVLIINYPLFVAVYRRRSRFYLTLAVVLNLANLGFFKYFYFAVETIAFFYADPELIAIARHEAEWFPEIILPLAISFYTFQIVSLHVDAYRGSLPERPGPFDFALFIMFFPQLIAGPIMRHNELLPQLNRPKDPDRVDPVRGLGLIASGFIKKVVIADFLSGTIVPVLMSPQDFQSGYVLLASYFFFVQVYCDFSGYTDFARGSALLLGFKLPLNFRGPMFALSFQEFWQRWHISLSSWLRDYIYIALGGSRVGPRRTYVNLFLTFFLGGVWHGAGWGFAIWGGFHGAYLAFERFLYKLDAQKVRLVPTWARRAGEADPAYRKRTIANVFRNIFMVLLMSLAGAFFWGGLNVELSLDILGSVFGVQSGAGAMVLTGRHFVVLMIYFGLHFLEYNDYFRVAPGEQGAAAIGGTHIFQRLAYRYAPLWIPAGAVATLFYASWRAGGDIPFVYFQF